MMEAGRDSEVRRASMRPPTTPTEAAAKPRTQRSKPLERLRGKEGLLETRLSPYIGYALLVAAFVVFLLEGNVAPAVVLLALGVVFVVAGGRQRVGKTDMK